MVECTTITTQRRRLFWATQVDGCGSETRCGVDCGEPNLAYTTQSGNTRTLKTTDWIKGLVINMLMTDGRRADKPCGYAPGSQGGHWSESFIEGGDPTIGTLMRTVPPTGTTAAATALVAAHAQATLQRLVTRGVAMSVDATATYVGIGKVQLNIAVVGVDGVTSQVGIDGARLTNGWVWN